jgi:hypothetical protein
MLFVNVLTVGAQDISRNTRVQLFDKQKQILEDTIQKRTNIDYAFIVGQDYIGVNDTVEHPYFDENKWQSGSLHFNGSLYKVEKLKYDIEIDKLIYLGYSNKTTISCIVLDNNFIPEFEISNVRFKYYRDLNNESGKKLKAGYYEIVYDGKLKFLVRSEKTRTLNSYTSLADMYVIKDGKVVKVRGMGKLIDLLSDKKANIKKFVLENTLKLSQTNYSSARRILEYYENL